MRIVDSAEDRRPRSRPVLFVVDDDVATLSLLCEVALDAGWDARGFSRLADLRAAIAADRPSLLILDDDLPDGRGGDLARELRDHPRLAGVPLLVCTAAHPMRQAEIGDWAPVVAKPFDIGSIERFLDAAKDAAQNATHASRDERAG
ncbi:MAG TPA: response regulator [Candidatus Angelobacter sp.]|nr:response regulator [Candidatus Angelobacter sp.]